MINAEIKAHIEGRYRNFQVTKADADGNPIPGTTKPAMMVKLDDTGNPIPGTESPAVDCHNLITDYGMDHLASNGTSLLTFNYCRVGTGNTAPSVSDVALVTQRGSSNTVGPGDKEIRRNVASTPYYYEVDVVRRFAAGAADGTLTEIGMSHAASGDNLTSRALIKDSGGTPAALVVAADEILDCTFTWRCYIPHADKTGSVTIKGTPYTWTMRPCAIESIGSSSSIGWPAFSVSASNGHLTGPQYAVRNDSNYTNQTGRTPISVSTATALVALNAELITSGSTPSSRAASNIIWDTYTPGSFELEQTLEWGLDRGNNSALGALQFQVGFGAFQLVFDGDTFSKDSSERMRFVIKTSLARGAP